MREINRVNSYIHSILLFERLALHILSCLQRGYSVHKFVFMSNWSKSMRETDRVCHIFSYFYVPLLTPQLCWHETALYNF